VREIVTLAFDWSREGLRTGEERRSEHDEPYLKTARSELEPVEASSSSRTQSRGLSFSDEE
jgi:hypothetical protein